MLGMLQTVASLLRNPPMDATLGDEEQIELSRVPGTIWNGVLRADRELVQRLAEQDERVLDTRGAVGDLPIHMLFLYNSPAHLELARWMLSRWPHLLTATYAGEEYLGENLLHIAIINQSESLVRELLDLCGGNEDTKQALLTARATGSFFRPGGACAYGETALSFALCTNQVPIARVLLEAGADLEATDSAGNNMLHLLVHHNLPNMYTFVKEEFKRRVAAAEKKQQQQHISMMQQQKPAAALSATAPSGSPIAPSTAASAGSPATSAAATAAANGAGPVLHQPPLWLRTNAAGLTPFCLSAQINALEMFPFLLEETRQTQWTFGPVSCNLYPLAELDLAISKEAAAQGGGVDALALAAHSARATATAAAAKAGTGSASAAIEARSAAEASLAASVGKEHPGALELIMNAGNVDLLTHPRMLDLVGQKWNKFAKRIFHQRFRDVLLYLAFFTLTIVVRQSVHNIARQEAAALAAGGAEAATAEATSRRWEGYIGWALLLYRFPLPVWLMEIGVLAGAGWKGRKELFELRRSGVVEYFANSSGSAFLENCLSVTFCACMMGVFLLNLLGLSAAEGPLLAVAAISGWSYLFFFLLAFRLTGPMVVMISRMLTHDVARFLLIYTVFMMGFAQSFFVLFESAGLSGFVDAVKTCFTAMLGQFDVEQFAQSSYAAVSVTLLIIYVVTITLLLLNLFIATMGSTFEIINEQSEKQWHLERARIIFAIEREMTSAERHEGDNKYWTTVNGERFLQVLEVNPNHFPKDATAAAWEAAEAAKKEEADG